MTVACTWPALWSNGVTIAGDYYGNNNWKEDTHLGLFAVAAPLFCIVVKPLGLYDYTKATLVNCPV